MSDDETLPPEDADRTITDAEDGLDPEAPGDSTQDSRQEENAATSLDQPSDGTS